MGHRTIRWEVADHIGTATLDRPERMNAFDQRIGDEFAHLRAAVREDDWP